LDPVGVVHAETPYDPKTMELDGHRMTRPSTVFSELFVSSDRGKLNVYAQVRSLLEDSLSNGVQ